MLQFVSMKHKFEKRSMKKLTFCRIKLYFKNVKKFSYGIRKVNTSKIFSNENKTYQKPIMKFSKKWLFTFLCHFQMSWELPQWTSKDWVCYFIFQMFICMKKIKMMLVYSLLTYFSLKNHETWLTRNIQDWFNIMIWHYRLIETSWKHYRNIIGWQCYSRATSVLENRLHLLNDTRP